MMPDITKHDLMLLKTLLLDVLDFSIDNQTNMTDLEESITESIDDMKEQLQDLETEIDERLSFLERRIIDFFDAYEDIIIQRPCIEDEDYEELPFPD